MGNNWDIIIIGAGASGLMAARTAGLQKKRVLVLEQMDKCGKKLLATGNGKCNFTNEYMETSCFFGEKTLIESVLSRFTKEDCLCFFHEIGIYPKSRNGYYYPASEQASSVVAAFENELKRLSVTINYSVTIKALLPTKYGVDIHTYNGNFHAKKLIIACGLLASPKLGSNGSLFTCIKSLGHRFMPILPALCGFYAKGLPFKKISGVRATGKIQAVVDGEIAGEDIGEIQFTEYGISGIPVFQISHYLSKALYGKNKTEVSINLLPDFSKEQLLKELRFRNQLGGNLLNGLLHQKLADVILKDFDGSDKKLEQIAEQLQHITITIEKPRDFEFAQVCMGGIPAYEINTSTLESKLVKHVYFAGEVLDVDGICGGYNLHFAWGSGYLAASHAANSI
uniref:NAD(P)/FAD-dependent oxidoreductase n=1 Tax=Agathobacter sp. TaxID=2021311 RepID=UPI00405651E3